MLFLWCFSSPICKKIHGRSRSTMHKWSRRRQNRAKTLSCLWQLRVKCNWVRRPSYYLKLCEFYGYEYLRSITTPLEEWQNNSVLYGGRRASRYWGFYRRVLPHLPHRRLQHRYRRSMKFYNVSSNNTKWEYEWESTGKPVATHQELQKKNKWK